VVQKVASKPGTGSSFPTSWQAEWLETLVHLPDKIKGLHMAHSAVFNLVWHCALLLHP
jgi:hypothetical protein